MVKIVDNYFIHNRGAEKNDDVSKKRKHKNW